MLEYYREIEDVDELQEKLPYKPYCTDNLKAGLKIRSRQYALKKKYIQMNPPNMKIFLTFDIDYPTWAYVAYDVDLPQPIWCVGNAKNGHCHLIYALNKPVITTSAAHLAPLKYLAAIETAMMEKLEADPMYNGLISKNPWRKDYWLVFQTCDILYSMDQLADNVKLTKKPTKRPVAEIAGLGRNCCVFENVRVWSYREIRNFWGKRDGLTAWTEAVNYRCQEENAKFSIPLEQREIRGIARSIAHWTWRRLNPDGFSEWQKNNIAKYWKEHSKKSQGIAMLQSGCSIDEVIQELGVCKATVYNWLKEAKPEEVKKTLDDTKPWEELGISRAWYYKLKKRK